MSEKNKQLEQIAAAAQAARSDVESRLSQELEAMSARESQLEEVR